MLVNRRTFLAKNGRVEDLVEALKTGANYLEWIPPFRVYTSHFGAFNNVQLELEFESLAEYERFWVSFDEAPESQEALEKFQDAALPGGSNEIWYSE